MKTFSRLSLFTLVCLGFALMLVGSATAQDELSLEVSGKNETYNTGDPIVITFAAKLGTAAQPGETLILTSSPNVSGVPASGVTNAVGILTVSATAATPAGSAFIEAKRKDTLTGKVGRAEFIIVEDGKSPVVIVVKSHEPKPEVKIGDPVTQTITIENRRDRFSSLRLSAWQMDIEFNPLILEVVDVTEGDFLESDGEDAVYAEMVSSGKISVSQARAEQMANPSPPPDNVASPHVADPHSPKGIALAPGEKGTLLTITFRVLAVAEETLGIHNVRLQSDEDDTEPLNGILDRISYSILVSDVIVTTHQSSAKEDVNQDGDVNILDLVMVSGSIGMVPGNPRADVNGDGFVNVLDLIQIYTSSHWATSVPSEKIGAANEPALTAPSVSRNLDPATIQSWIDLAQVEDDGSAIFDLGIANLEALLASRIPSDTRLLLNYPNPFNPETWIPYQLAEATDVRVMIHSVNGSLIRMLELGHQAAGTYKNKSQAAYWDGRNELGEQVASGLYFYTLTAGDFSATGKMLIRK